MGRFGREIGISLIVGLIVAAIWATLGITATHSPWSWPDFFGRSAAVAVPVAAWKVVGAAKIALVLAVVLVVGVVVLALGALILL
jgi:hypothetical protein